MNRKTAIFAVLGIMILAVAIRVWGIGWGLPTAKHFYSYHPDENIVFSAALNINLLDGQLDPKFFNYGSLYLYLVSIGLVLASGSGFVNLGKGDMAANIAEISKMYLTGRVVALLLGVLTVYAVYRLGKRAYGRGTGVLAALFMAVAPIHVMHSKFLAVDVPSAFFVTLALIFAIRIFQEDFRARDYILAGLFAGFAAATKYNAGLVILAPAMAHMVTDRARPGLRIFNGKLWLIPIASVIGFLIGTPGILIDFEKFSRDFSYEMAHVRTGHGLVFTNTGPGWIYHLSHSFWPGMGLPLAILAGIGVLYALRKRSAADWCMLAFSIVYYAVIGAAQVRFARYTIPLLPVLTILAARVSVDAVDRLVHGKDRCEGACLASQSAGFAVSLLLILVVGYTAAYSVALDQMMLRKDTRDRAEEWISANIPHGISIGFPTIPWFYTPPLDPEVGMSPEAPERYAKSQEVTDYSLVVDPDGDWSADFLRKKMPSYLVMSSFEYADPLRVNDPSATEYSSVVQRDYLLEQRFSDEPTIFGRRIPLLPSLPHDMSYADPTVLIYSKKDAG
jgi:hypothetical protein